MIALTLEAVRELMEGCEGVQGGPWTLDQNIAYIWAPSEKGGDFPLLDKVGGEGHVARLRGWGYYSGKGHGALGLSEDDAEARQKRTGEHLARCSPEFILALTEGWIEMREALEQRTAELDHLRKIIGFSIPPVPGQPS